MIDAVRVALTAVRTGDRPRAGDLRSWRCRACQGLLLGFDDLRRPHLLLALEHDGAVSGIRRGDSRYRRRSRSSSARPDEVLPRCDVLVRSPWQTCSNISSPPSRIAF